MRPGRGLITIRARAGFEEAGHDKVRIVITEIPYMVNKASLVESIALLVKSKKIEGVTDLRDESDREGMRIVLELKRDAVEDVVLNQLYKYTELQSTFGVILLVLVDGQPRILNLKGLLEQFLKIFKIVARNQNGFSLFCSQGHLGGHGMTVCGGVAGIQQLQYILVTLRVARAGHIRVSQFVHQRQPGPAGQQGIQVQLLELHGQRRRNHARVVEHQQVDALGGLLRLLDLSRLADGNAHRSSHHRAHPCPLAVGFFQIAHAPESLALVEILGELILRRRRNGAGLGMTERKVIDAALLAAELVKSFERGPRHRHAAAHAGQSAVHGARSFPGSRPDRRIRSSAKSKMRTCSPMFSTNVSPCLPIAEACSTR